MTSPSRVYAEALRRGDDLVARDAAGAAQPVAVTRWLARACDVDERVLRHATGPVLDVGCGPGRHVRALRRRNIEVLGIDLSPVAVRLARRGGAGPVLVGDVFAPVPRGGWWRTGLLLDGNLGIGGDPSALLARVHDLLAPGGRVLCETDAPGCGLRVDPVRLEHDDRCSRWFPWARVGADAVDAVAAAAGLAVTERWEDGGRWFAVIA